MRTKFPNLETAALTEAYDLIVRRIETGTVTTDDFNSLLEALDKSVRERVARHLRVPKVEPKSVNMPGRVVPKRKGIDDPPSQHRGRRYAAGTAAKKKQNREQSKAWQKKHSDRLRDDMLEQVLRRPVLSEDQIKVIQKIITNEQWACPHCDQLITERSSLYHDGHHWFHRPCQDKGPVRLPPADWSNIDPQWCEILQNEE